MPVFVDQICIILKEFYLIFSDLGVFLIITAGECVDPLVSGLYASSFLASSRYNFLYSANFAKLYGRFLIVVLSSPFDRNTFLIAEKVIREMMCYQRGISNCLPILCTFFPFRQQWLVPITQGQTAMAAGRPWQEVSTEGHCHPGDLQLI